MVRLPAVLVLLICTVSIVHAEIIEFSVPGLAGGSTDSVRIDSLVYNGPTAVVNSMLIRVTGVVDDLGEICCGGPEYCTGDTSPWFMTWWCTVERSGDAVYGEWSASCSEYLAQVAPFDQIGGAESRNGFPSLADGDVLEIALYFGKSAWLGDCELYRSPSGTMYTVTVIMNVSATLPTEDATWGRIKTLFN